MLLLSARICLLALKCRILWTLDVERSRMISVSVFSCLIQNETGRCDSDCFRDVLLRSDPSAQNLGTHDTTRLYVMPRTVMLKREALHCRAKNERRRWRSDSNWATGTVCWTLGSSWILNVHDISSSTIKLKGSQQGNNGHIIQLGSSKNSHLLVALPIINHLKHHPIFLKS